MKKNTVKPLSLIILLITAAISAYLCYLLINFDIIIPKTYLYIIIGVIGFLNLICLLAALVSEYRWLQYIVSLLLIIVGCAGIYTCKTINKVITYPEKIITSVPDTTSHSIYLVNRYPYMIIDEIEGHTIKVGLLNDYNDTDITPAVEELESRNATLDTTYYDDLFELLIDWHDHSNDYESKIMSALLPD